jgi:hypothetical protein
MAESKFEKYVTRKPLIVTGPGADYVVRYKTPETGKIPLINQNNTGPRLIFSKEFVPEATIKIEYGFILGETVLLNDGKNYGAHRHGYSEVFLFLGNDPQDTGYLGAEGEFWLGEGDDLEKIRFNTSCSIYVPSNVAHFPLFFKNVKTPVMMGVVISQAGDMVNIPVTR